MIMAIWHITTHFVVEGLIYMLSGHLHREHQTFNNELGLFTFFF